MEHSKIGILFLGREMQAATSCSEMSEAKDDDMSIDRRKPKGAAGIKSQSPKAEGRWSLEGGTKIG